MPTNTQEVETILKLNVDYQQGIKDVGAYLAEIKKLKDEQSALNKALKDNQITEQQYGDAMAKNKTITAQLNGEMKVLTTELKKKLEADRAEQKQIDINNASYNELSKTYAQMKKRINDMDAAERQRNKAYIDQSKAVYERMKRYDGPWCLESFDPRAVQWFRLNAPEIIRGQLAFDNAFKGKNFHEFMRNLGMASMLQNFASRPDFIAFGAGTVKWHSLPIHLLRLMKPWFVAWTVRSQEDMDKTREFLLKDYKKNIEQNGWWSRTLKAYYENGVNMVADYEAAVNGVTSDDVKALAKRLLDEKSMVKVIMRPEK